MENSRHPPRRKLSIIQVASLALCVAVASAGSMQACTQKAAPDANPVQEDVQTSSGEAKTPTAAQLTAKITEIEAIADDICRCADEACIKSTRASLDIVMLTLTRWGRYDMNNPPAEDFMNKLTVAAQKMRKCIAKTAPQMLRKGIGAGGPKAPPTAAQLRATIAELNAIVETICRCTNDDCDETERAQVEAFKMKIRSWGRPDTNDPATKTFLRKLDAATEKLAACLAKTAPMPGASE